MAKLIDDSPATTSSLLADRRPIAARRFPVFHWMAKRLAIAGISANAISVFSIVFAIGAGSALGLTPHVNEPWARLLMLAGAGLIQLRLLANMLDGMVAIEHSKSSPLGTLYNEVPDRISDVAILIGAGYAIGGDVVLGFVAACAALFTAYVRAMGKVAGGNQEFCGPMAKQQRMAVITAAAIYLAVAPPFAQPAWQGRGVVAAALLVVNVGSVFTSIRRLKRIARTLQNTQDRGETIA